MRVTKKVIEDVVSEASGEDVVPLIRYLKDKKNISEFKIAEKIKKEVNVTRNMLYRLFEANLVSFIRKKDKTKGWYIYYWTFNPKRVKYLMYDLKRKKLDNLKSRLKREDGNYFFVCDDNCIRLDFEQATDFNFKCPECGRLVNQEDNASKIEDIKKEIKALEREIKKRPN
jgi:transcription initiation factor TFIIE subunit alpha|tara:strand:- start:65 stop:577 length:513 start_codon:yes stop_codon:yes gene_type:complete